MSKALSNNIEIEYDTFGDSASDPLLLIQGLGAQMIAYTTEFCNELVKQGFYVIRFDNRDIGLSTKFEDFGIPNMQQVFMDKQLGKETKAPYTLGDMANDAVGLLDFLQIKKAHILGCSMGGMIAQMVPILHPHKVKSLISIMSSTGDPTLPGSKPEVAAAMFAPVAPTKEAIINNGIKLGKMLYGKGFPFNEERARVLAELAYKRSYYPQGYLRQTLAIMVGGDRTERLKALTVPTLVIHGGDDDLIHPDCGKATAAAIPNSELLIVPGMGHSLPIPAWPQVISAISKLRSI